ncbi:MAG: aspartate kinase [Flavobacteriaceae bacterium]|nr:aspartate kinase [Flavobacteriaceae bacterium]
MSSIVQQAPEVRINLSAIKKKRINLVVFGHGNVGGKLIDQLLQSAAEVSRRKELDIRIVGIANSTSMIVDDHGFTDSWRTHKSDKGAKYRLQDVIEFVKSETLDNLIAVDNTASSDFVENYEYLVKNGFHIVSANKIANTLPYTKYEDLRKTLSKYRRQFLYETNVGAGLPLIDTIKLLHNSGENIIRIKGVFSGSLSYIFNVFSEGNRTFSSVLQSAMKQGYTEPDPREDLSGKDVARKLLILARELELISNLEDVNVQNLIPNDLRKVSTNEFLKRAKELDIPYLIKLKNQKEGYVLRYVADLHGDLSKEDGGKLEVRLLSVPKNSVLGRLEGSDTIFEIYTENYAKRPLVIQGAGAGAEVTARGVFGDILRLSEKL